MDLSKMKGDIKNSGGAMGALFYLKPDTKRRVRFLQEFDTGVEVVFHDNYDEGIFQPCLEPYGVECPYCDETGKGWRTKSLYCWSVWDVDSKEVKLMCYAANNYSPVPNLLAMYEQYGTLLDRDFVIQQSGSKQNKSFAVMPMDKAKFSNKKAKAFSESQVMKTLKKAYLQDEEALKGKSDDDTSGSSDDWGDDDDAVDYSTMSAKELYGLCKEREIDVPTRKSDKFYIKELKKWDEAQNDDDDWGDDDGDDW